MGGGGEGGGARIGEVFLAFLKLGCTSFGGPIAHLGYFRAEFVHRRRWLDDAAYADLVALSQFLPGPASSQVGIAIGLLHAGWLGSLAAWLAFTLPSAALMIAFASGLSVWGAAVAPAVHGLVVAAVAVVAVAVLGMARTLCPDRLRAGIALATAMLMLIVPGGLATPASFVAVVLGAVVGIGFVAADPVAIGASAALEVVVGRRTGAALLAAFATVLVGLPLLAAAIGSDDLRMASVFYRAGALVFGGGHVVLPWLEAGIVGAGWLDPGTFFAGYGAAQAVPGPLFTFAAYLGALLPVLAGGVAGGVAMLVAIFLPAYLLVVGALPFWTAVRARRNARTAMAGVNAAVVGLLLAALVTPLATTALHSFTDVALAAAAFAALWFGRWPPVLVVALAAFAGWALG